MKRKNFIRSLIAAPLAVKGLISAPVKAVTTPNQVHYDAIAYMAKVGRQAKTYPTPYQYWQYSNWMSDQIVKSIHPVKGSDTFTPLQTSANHRTDTDPLV